jgi:hypothetical protein
MVIKLKKKQYIILHSYIQLCMVPGAIILDTAKLIFNKQRIILHVKNSAGKVYLIT